MNSTRGKRKLVDELNFIYNFKKKNADDSICYWKCEEKECKARVHTLTNDCKIINKIGEHEHMSSASEPKIRKILSEIKGIAETSKETSRSLIATAATKLNIAEMSEFPKGSLLSRNIRKWRNTNNSAQCNPSSRMNYEIPESYKYIILAEKDRELFLQIDSGKEDENRILIFATNSGLDDLEMSCNWAGDGTFKICPSIFFQLYTIHTQFQSFSVPRVFALLPNKSHETYLRLFKFLVDLRHGLNPKSFMMDFEKAHINAIQEIFPECEITSSSFIYLNQFIEK
jgi:hypothetical protein